MSNGSHGHGKYPMGILCVQWIFAEILEMYAAIQGPVNLLKCYFNLLNQGWIQDFSHPSQNFRWKISGRQMTLENIREADGMRNKHLKRQQKAFLPL